MNLDELFDKLRQERELQKRWDAMPRSERPLRDSEKPVEFWVSSMNVCMNGAAQEAYASTDKTEALKKIYEAVALGLACLEHNPLPEKFFQERYGKKD